MEQKPKSVDYDQLYGEYFSPVQRFLAQLVDPSEAEDLAQEVFLKIHQALPSFRGESKLSTWIYRIATNTAIDRIRSPSRRAIESQLPLDEAESCCAETIPPATMGGGSEVSVEHAVFQQARLDCYLDNLRNLPIRYRLVVALSELDGLVADEIAAILGISVENAKIRLHRGRKKLLADLRAHCKPEDWL